MSSDAVSSDAMSSSFTSEVLETPSCYDALLAPFAVPIDEQLKQWAERYGDRLALSDAQRRLSYAALNEQVDVAAGHLHAMGISAGDHAVLQLPNGVDFVIALFALMRSGALPILAIPSLRAHDLVPIIKATHPVAYFTADRQHLERTLALAEHSDCLRHMIVSHPNATLPDDPRVTRLSDLYCPCPSPQPLRRRSGRDIALLLLSGGTTGTPKLIPRTHADYSYNVCASAALCGLNEHSVYLAVLPIAHNFPLACPGVLGALSQGGRAVLSETASVDDALPLIEREGVTHVALVPALARLWQQAREWESSDLSSLRVIQVGGARLDPQVAKALRATFSCTLQQVFGMAEGLLCCTRLDDDDTTQCFTQGRPLSALDEVRIVDDHDAPLPTGHTGQLLARGPYTITAYYRAPAHSAHAFTADGFYRTGDLALCDAGGNLQIKGRLKEDINRAGEKISAAAIESLVMQQPDISDCAVVAVPDELLGERICAFLLAHHVKLSLSALRQRLIAQGLSPHALPDQLIYLTHWPLTAVGKIDKQALSRRADTASAHL